MNMQNTQNEQHLGFRNEETSKSSASLDPDSPISSSIELQTSGYNPSSSPLIHKGTPDQPLVTDLYIFSLDRVKEELNEIREEVEETREAIGDVIIVPESAYSETVFLLEQLHHDVPMPDMMWLENGGIGLEWRPREGIATMSLYGDGLVVYGAFFSKNREISGICSLDDTAFLQGFLTTLSRLC